MTEEIRVGCKADDYTEIDLKKWSKGLETLRKQLDTSIKIKIMHVNRDISHAIRLIKLKENPQDSKFNFFSIRLI